MMRSLRRALGFLALTMAAACLGPELPPDNTDASLEDPPKTGGSSTPDAGSGSSTSGPSLSQPPSGILAGSGGSGSSGSAGSGGGTGFDSRPVDSSSPALPRDAGVERVIGGPASDIKSPSPLFGFENAAPDWISNEAVLTRDPNKLTEGAASLMFVVKNYIKITSRAFDTGDLPNVTGRLQLDVYLTFPDGQVSLFFECQAARVGGTNLGTRMFNGYPLEAWNTIFFEVPARVATALSTKNNGCKLWFDHNGNGVTRYDRLAFVP